MGVAFCRQLFEAIAKNMRKDSSYMEREAMRVEIERRFLVCDDRWNTGAAGQVVRQGYLSARDGVTVRVRRIGALGFLTIKGPRSGIVRPEFEYAIGCDEADFMLENLCRKPLIKKIRYTIDYFGVTWTVDVFQEDFQGLVIAECELTNMDEVTAKPPWIGPEITEDERYRNSRLAEHGTDLMIYINI